MKKKGLTILEYNKGIGNNHSKIDGIGAERASIPTEVYSYLINTPEFDWVFESNEMLEKFLILNPQYDMQYRHKFNHDEILRIPITNKDKKIYSIGVPK